MKKVRKITEHGFYDMVGTVIMECGNGVVVEWERYTAELGYGDLYKSVLLFKPHTEKDEFLADDISNARYEWAQ